MLMRLRFEAKSRKGCGSFCPFTKEILSCILPGSVWKIQQQQQPDMVIVKTFAILLAFSCVYHFSWIRFSIFMGLGRRSLMLYYWTTMYFKAHPPVIFKRNLKNLNEIDDIVEMAVNQESNFLFQLVVQPALGRGCRSCSFIPPGVVTPGVLVV